MKLSYPPFSLILVLTLLCMSALVVAQESESKINRQIWVDFIPHFKVSDAIEIYGDASFRMREFGSWTIYSIRPSVKYQVGPIVSIHGGLGAFYNNISDFSNNMEIRPWQGIRIGWPKIRRLNIKHYVRAEERYFIQTEDGKANLWTYRGRYQISSKLAINKKVVQNHALYIPLAFEWLASSDEQLQVIWASQSRMTAGIGYVLSKKWILEFEYMHWWSKNLPSQEFASSDDIFRFRFIHNGWISGE